MMPIANGIERSPAHDSAEPQSIGAREGGAGDAMIAVFEALERSGVRYCVMHGYAGYPHTIPSDVDCIIDPRVTAKDLQSLIHDCAQLCGFEVVRREGYHVVVTGHDDRKRLWLLTFDFSTDCEFAGIPFYSADEVLGSRQKHANFWIPRTDLEFAGYLARTIARRSLDGPRGKRLHDLFRRDPENCRREIARFWKIESAALIAAAAETGEWAPVRERLSELASELRRRAIRRVSWRYARRVMNACQSRLRRVLNPPGVYVVLLGPDGAGKSSVIDGLGPKLRDLFPRALSYGFAPEFMQRMLHGKKRKTDTPHALQPRSMPVSIARALLYWLPYYTLGYLGRHVELIRSALVLNDRHFIDILVDGKRYRYGGPHWLLHWIWRASVKPDLIVLLDAPADVLYARKQEMGFDELSRQRDAYVKLVKSVPNGHIVDAALPLDQVIDRVGDLVVKLLIRRQSG